MSLTTEPAGPGILHNPRLNKGVSFTGEERARYGIEGLLPPGVITLEHQVARIHLELSHLENDLQKYLLLSDLQSRNETLYYATLMSDPATFTSCRSCTPRRSVKRARNSTTSFTHRGVSTSPFPRVAGSASC
jgi:hypothetical protein